MNPAVNQVQTATKLPRSVALDVFRGLTVLLMLLVNNVALDTATPDQLTHAPWGQGIRLADIVFPWFLLCVGLSIPLSQASADRNGLTVAQRAWRVLRRVVVLFAVGCLIQSLLHHEVWISMDVLQLIALSYGLGYVLSLRNPQVVVPVTVLAVAAYGFVMRHAPYPGANGVFDADHNAIAWFNEAALKPWKFDGLLSVIPGTALVLTGVYFSRFQRKYETRVASLGFGCGLLALGWLASYDLTPSKQFWTPSYILLCAGLGIIVLTTLQSLEQRANFPKLTWPLVVFGANPLACYVAPILVKLTLLTWITVPSDAGQTSLADNVLQVSYATFGRIQGGWVYTTAYIATVWVFGLILFKSGKFVRI